MVLVLQIQSIKEICKKSNHTVDERLKHVEYLL